MAAHSDAAGCWPMVALVVGSLTLLLLSDWVQLSNKDPRQASYSNCVGIWSSEDHKLKCAREIYGQEQAGSTQ